jgi:lipopolysaccharide transport system ATP-binding protein
MSAPAITVENLSKRYLLHHSGGGSGLLRDRLAQAARAPLRWLNRTPTPSASSEEIFWALRDVSFSVPQGEVLGIVGRNGAGKSTLLKILSRITEPTDGRVRLRGRVASLLEVGTGFHPELTGRENVFLNGAILGMQRAEIRRKFDEIVAFAEVEKFLDTPVKHYSSGMYVRLAFAVAAHLEPEILIVDEVLAVGELAFQKKCLGKMQAVSRGDGRTVLFVSHNINAVRQLCQSALLLAGGRVQAVDSAARVLDLYLRNDAAGSAPRIPRPAPELSDRAFVTGVTIETGTGEARAVFAVGEPWRIRVRFVVARPYDAFVVAVGLVSGDGSPAQTAWGVPAPVTAGSYEALFEQTAHLQAGPYTLLVGLSASDQSIQQIEAARFDISGDRAQGYFPITAGAGIVLNSMRITLKRE